MKFRKALFGILLVSAMLFCVSCGLIGDQKYDCDAAAVDTVQIVKLENYVEGEYRYEYTVLSEITDKAAFIERLNNMEHSMNWGDPYVLESGYVVIKIDYLNGDYDLIYSNAQWFNRSGVNQDGYFCFDKEQFDLLISDYSKE